MISTQKDFLRKRNALAPKRNAISTRRENAIYHVARKWRFVRIIPFFPETTASAENDRRTRRRKLGTDAMSEALLRVATGRTPVLYQIPTPKPHPKKPHRYQRRDTLVKYQIGDRIL